MNQIMQEIGHENVMIGVIVLVALLGVGLAIISSTRKKFQIAPEQPTPEQIKANAEIVAAEAYIKSTQRPDMTGLT